jgi:hypothetical protein
MQYPVLMEISKLIVPLGIVTYVLVAATFFSGRFRAKLHLKLALHRRLAYTALGMATVHGALVLIFF